MLTRKGIVSLLEEAGIEVAAEAPDAKALLRHMRHVRPDAAIVDIRMPPTHTDEGLVAAQAIRSEHLDVGVLLLSHHVEPSYRSCCLQSASSQSRAPGDQAKRKILGENLAKLHGIDVEAKKAELGVPG